MIALLVAMIYLPYTLIWGILAILWQIFMAIYSPAEVNGPFHCSKYSLSRILGVQLDDLANGDRLTLVTLQNS